MQNAGHERRLGHRGGPELQEPDDPARAAIVVVHGGSWARGDKADIAWRAVCQWLASAGYVALLGRTTGSRRRACFPAAIDDVQAAVAWLREDEQVTRFHIDPDRIGAFGGSAGGNLVALLGTRGSGDLTIGSRVAAVVDLSGPIDLTGLAVTDDFVPVQLAYLGCATRGGLPVGDRRVADLRDRRDRPAVLRRRTRRPRRSRSRRRELFVAGLRAAGVPRRIRHRRGHAALDRDARRRPEGADHRLLRRDDRHPVGPARRDGAGTARAAPADSGLRVPRRVRVGRAAGSAEASPAARG